MITKTRSTSDQLYSHLGGNRAVTIDFCEGLPAQEITSITVPSSAFTCKGKVESITTRSGRGRPNPCKHAKHSFEIGINESIRFALSSGRPGNCSYSPAPYWANWNRDMYNAYGYTDLSYAGGPIGPYGLPTGWEIDTSGINETKLRNDVLEKARNLKADVLLNLLEANQLPGAIRSVAPTLPSLGRSWKQIRKVIKTASGGYLAYAFGIRPLVGDLINIGRYMEKIRQDYKDHLASKPRRYSIVATLPVSYNNPITGTSDTVYSSQGFAEKAPVVRYVLVVRPARVYHTQLLNALEFGLRRFASSPASLAWERIPFSFVLDWFVDIRSTLDVIDKSIGAYPFEIMAFTRSFSYDCRTEVHVDLKSACGNGTLDSWRMFSASTKYYERTLVTDGWKLPTLSGVFGKNQYSTAAALLASNLKDARRYR
jgi:hypothetical protein